MNSKCTTDLNAKPETKNLMEKKKKKTYKKTFATILLGKAFLNTTPKAQSIKKKMAKFDFTKFKILLFKRET